MSEQSRSAGVSRAVLLGLLCWGLLSTAAAGGVPASKAIVSRSQLARVESNTRSLLGGVPEHGNTLGRANAPLTLCWFGDLQSPITATFDEEVLPSLIRRWVRGGRLRIEYRSLETSTREYPEFKRQQVAALAAGAGGRMWYFLQLFYHDQRTTDTRYATWPFLDLLARHVPGLQIRRWRRAQHDGGYVEQLASDEALAEQNRIEGTPAFLFGHTGGTLRTFDFTTIEDPARFERSMRRALAP